MLSTPHSFQHNTFTPLLSSCRAAAATSIAALVSSPLLSSLLSPSCSSSSPLLPSVSQLVLPPFLPSSCPPSLPCKRAAAAASLQLCKGGKGSAALFFYNISLAAAASKTRKGSAAAR